MTSERNDVPRYKVISPSFEELVKKSEQWDRVFPEAAQWRREQYRRAQLEASSDKEFLEMRVAIVTGEFELFPEVNERILRDHTDDVIDSYESELGLRYMYLFGLINPISFKYGNGARQGIDWEKVLDISF